jgi:hypothetical protein
MPINISCRGTAHSQIFVNVKKGEFLKYSVTARGAKTTFALVDKKFGSVLLSDADTPAQTSPDVVFERQWPLAHDQVAVDTDHTLGMHFIDPSTKYTYKVTLHRPDGTQDTVQDCDFSVSGDEFFFPQVLKVVSLVH